MKIIDAHAHIFPEKIADKATHAISEFYSNYNMEHIGSPDELLKSGRRAGVSKYMVFSTATVEKQVRSINDFVIEQARIHDEFIPVGTMHMDYADFEEEIERISSLGVKGIKLHPDFQRFNLDDEKMNPIFDLMEKKDMFLITHSGDYRYGFSHPLRVANVAKRFKKLRIIAAHCGGWSQWEIARECMVLPNIYVDTCSTTGFIKDDIISKTIKAFGKDRIFFGTDFPMWDHEGELERLYSLNLKDDILECILYKNFAGFYGLE